MKRWAICRVGDYEGDGALVPKLNLYPSNSRIWTKPGFNWCFGQFSVADLTAIQADPDIYVLPDGGMDMAVSSIPSNIRTTMRNRLEAAGFTFNDVKLTWTMRELLTYIAHQIQIVNIEAGDVRDIEQ